MDIVLCHWVSGILLSAIENQYIHYGFTEKKNVGELSHFLLSLLLSLDGFWSLFQLTWITSSPVEAETPPSIHRFPLDSTIAPWGQLDCVSSQVPSQVSYLRTSSFQCRCRQDSGRPTTMGFFPTLEPQCENKPDCSFFSLSLLSFHFPVCFPN